MLTFDPPEHTRLRAALSTAMPPERVRMLRPEIEAITYDLVIQLLTHGEKPFDLLTELALPLSIRVIARLLGIPPSDEALIQAWSMELLRADLEARDQTSAIADDINTYLVALANEKRLAPDESIMSSFVQMKQPEALLSEEISAMSFLLLTAGHETSVNLITNGVLNLLRSPTIWRRLCTDLSLAGAVTEEILRFESPLEFATPRYAAADMIVDGQKICRGDLVFVGIGTANRDPLVFNDPNTFNIDRKNNARQIAFGQGIHACPGAHLARLEGETVFALLANHMPNLELATCPNELEWIPGIVMRGLVALHVRNKPDNI
jgi:cytochrome P450 PksS